MITKTLLRLVLMIEIGCGLSAYCRALECGGCQFADPGRHPKRIQFRGRQKVFHTLSMSGEKAG